MPRTVPGTPTTLCPKELSVGENMVGVAAAAPSRGTRCTRARRRPPARMDHHEAAAADVARRRMRDRQGERRGDGRIDGVAALLQDFHSRLASQPGDGNDHSTSGADDPFALRRCKARRGNQQQQRQTKKAAVEHRGALQMGRKQCHKSNLTNGRLRALRRCRNYSFRPGKNLRLKISGSKASLGRNPLGISPR